LEVAIQRVGGAASVVELALAAKLEPPVVASELLGVLESYTAFEAGAIVTFHDFHAKDCCGDRREIDADGRINCQ
jgi:hypothetical protein